MTACVLSAAACSDPDTERIKKTTIPTYDKTTGKLTELTYDRDKNGRIDTWTDMDGTRPLRTRIDLDEDGKIDRWEYYDDKGALLRVGFSRKQDGKVDAWAYSAPDGTLGRVEISSTGDEKKIDRREFYEAGGSGPRRGRRRRQRPGRPVGDVRERPTQNRGDGREWGWNS